MTVYGVKRKFLVYNFWSIFVVRNNVANKASNELRIYGRTNCLISLCLNTFTIYRRHCIKWYDHTKQNNKNKYEFWFLIKVLTRYIKNIYKFLMALRVDFGDAVNCELALGGRFSNCLLYNQGHEDFLAGKGANISLFTPFAYCFSSPFLNSHSPHWLFCILHVYPPDYWTFWHIYAWSESNFESIYTRPSVHLPACLIFVVDCRPFAKIKILAKNIRNFRTTLVFENELSCSKGTPVNQPNLRTPLGFLLIN